MVSTEEVQTRGCDTDLGDITCRLSILCAPDVGAFGEQGHRTALHSAYRSNSSYAGLVSAEPRHIYPRGVNEATRHSSRTAHRKATNKIETSTTGTTLEGQWVGIEAVEAIRGTDGAR